MEYDAHHLATLFKQMPRTRTLDELPIVHAPPAVTAAQMAEVDRAATRDLGIALEMLMENASRAVAHAARICLGGSIVGRRVVALSGHGSNGGDALGAARHLLNWGARVTCVVAGSPTALRPVPRRQFDILVAMRASPAGTALGRGGAVAEEAPLEQELARAELVLDGLLGYSIAGAPRGDIAALIRLANGSRAPILAIDLPSGMHPDTGAPLGLTIRAAFTVTLALPKTGLLAAAARDLVGELLLCDIAIPPLVYERFGLDASRVFAEGDLVRIAR